VKLVVSDIDSTLYPNGSRLSTMN